MDRYRRRIAMLSVGAQLGCPLRRRIEGEIEIARPVEIVFETTATPTTTAPSPDRTAHAATPAQRVPARNTSRASTQRRAVSVEPLAPSAPGRELLTPSPQPFCICLLITSLLILVGLGPRLSH
jgi:hypothetical protein